MALGKKFYRQAWPDMREDLRRAGASTLARRCYDELTIGRHSSATGAILLEPEYLRIDLGEHSRAKVVAALEELEHLGWLSWCRHTRAAVLPLHAHRCAGDNPSHTQGLLAECRSLPPSAQRDLAIEIITKVSKGSKEALARLNGESPHQKQEQNQEQKQKKTPIGVPAVAAAPVTGWTFQPHKPKPQDHTLESPKSEEEQRLYSNDKGSSEPEATTGQGDSPAFRESYEEEEVPDWAAAAMAKAAVPDALPSFPGVRNPEVAARLAAADAERQASLTLTPPKSKPKRDLTPKQLDAIFAREQMAKWVGEWNGPSGMALVNAPAVMADVAKLATVLMGHAARLVSVDGALVGPHQLLGWAAQHGGYHGGQGPKKWTLKGWLAADHVGEVFAEYRDWCAKQERQKRWRYNIERTLTDWREECAEAAELAARFAEVSDAA